MVSLAAKKLIQGLQDSDENSESTVIKKEIIQLSCQYGNSARLTRISTVMIDAWYCVGLASRYTSCVAIDPKE